MQKAPVQNSVGKTYFTTVTANAKLTERTSKMAISTRGINRKSEIFTVTNALNATSAVGCSAFLIGASATLIGCTAISVAPAYMPWIVFSCGAPWYISMAMKDALLLLGRETLKWSIPTMVLGGAIALGSYFALRAYRKRWESQCLNEHTQYVLA